jgi:hypothetical protein
MNIIYDGISLLHVSTDELSFQSVLWYFTTLHTIVDLQAHKICVFFTSVLGPALLLAICFFSCCEMRGLRNRFEPFFVYEIVYGSLYDVLS